MRIFKNKKTVIKLNKIMLGLTYGTKSVKIEREPHLFRIFAVVSQIKLKWHTSVNQTENIIPWKQKQPEWYPVIVHSSDCDLVQHGMEW